jgi:hypothetical protein
VLVEVEEAEHPVVDQEHVGPGAHAPGMALDGFVPSGDAGHAPGIADFRFEEPVEHVDPGVERVVKKPGLGPQARPLSAMAAD